MGMERGMLLEGHTIVQTGGVDGEQTPGLVLGELALVSVFFLLGDHGLVISSPHDSVSPVMKSVMN